MRLLSQQQVQRSRAFLQNHARVLDAKLAEFYFWDGSAEDVREALLLFQNSDGGFGHSIEPDFRLEPSSAMGTSIGLQYAREIGLDSTDPLIQGAVTYLLATLDPHEHRWHAVPESVNHVPHAPWWSVDTTTGRSGVEGTWANPNAELLGYLWQFEELVPMSLLQSLTEKAILELEQMPEKIDLHDFLCYQRLVEFLPDPHRTVVMNRLTQSVLLTVETSPEQWGNYGAKPLHIAPSPSSPVANVISEALHDNLDYEIVQMNEDGSWSPNWSWFGNYDDDWTVAEQEWKGFLTVRNLKSLCDFGRIEK